MNNLTPADVLLMAPGGFPKVWTEEFGIQEITSFDYEIEGGNIETPETIYWFSRKGGGNRLVSDLKLVLRPLDSMTEDEAQTLHKMMWGAEYEFAHSISFWWQLESQIKRKSARPLFAVGEWLISKNFDVYGMIEAGKAIPEPKPQES